MMTDLPSITPEDPGWAEKSSKFISDWVQKAKDKAVDLKDRAHQTLKNMTTIQFKRLTETAKAPTRAHDDDLGVDLYIDYIEYAGKKMDRAIVRTSFDPSNIPPLVPFKIYTGVAFQYPSGYGAKINDRSSKAEKGFLSLGRVLDENYRGEVIVCCTLINADPNFSLELKRGDKICQIVLQETKFFPLVEVDELGETERADKGFGSSGV